jgi:glycosyltransferase involved in cell wall biosynthesis
MVARFEAFKRHDLMAESFERLFAQDHAARLLLVGEPIVLDEQISVYNRIVSQIKAAGISHAVKMLPFQEDIRTVLAASDVVVQCSNGEPLGMALLEAIALEIPVLVTASSGIAELLLPEYSDAIVPDDDPDSLSTALKRILDEDECTLASRKAAMRRIVKSKASSHNCATQLMGVYDDVLKASHIRPAAELGALE